MNRTVFVIEEVFLTDDEDGRMNRFHELLASDQRPSCDNRTEEPLGR